VGSNETIWRMGIFLKIGWAIGLGFYLLSSLFAIAIRWIRQFFIDLWQGSLKWEWFAVLLLGAVGLAGIDEFGGAVVVGTLAIVSIASKYWHWAEKYAFTRKTRIISFPGMLALLVLLFFEVNDIRGSKPWSHFPKAWNNMLVAFAFRVEEFPLRQWPIPSPPDLTYTPTPLKPVSTRKSIVHINGLLLDPLVAGKPAMLRVRFINEHEETVQLYAHYCQQGVDVLPGDFDVAGYTKIENELWECVENEVKKGPKIILEAPSKSEMQITSSHTETIMTQELIDAVNTGSSGIYFAGEILDSSGKYPPTPYCVRADKNNARPLVSMCHSHN
jgi:hypothetical protein